jgi:hypothetical protein
MKDFIKSLNKAQREGLVGLIQNHGKNLQVVAYVLEEQSKGNSEPYEQYFGPDPVSTSSKSIKESSEDIHPAVVDYTKLKMEAAAAREKEEASKQQKRGYNPYLINEGRDL